MLKKCFCYTIAYNNVFYKYNKEHSRDYSLDNLPELQTKSSTALILDWRQHVASQAASLASSQSRWLHSTERMHFRVSFVFLNNGGERKWEKCFEPEYSQNDLIFLPCKLSRKHTRLLSELPTCCFSSWKWVSCFADRKHFIHPSDTHLASSVCLDMIAHGLSTHPCLFSSKGTAQNEISDCLD